MEKSSQTAWAKDDLIGGHPVLDFLNTTGGRSKRRDTERLTDFSTLLEWSLVAGLLSETERSALSNRAHSDPDSAEEALATARRFREALHRCLMDEQAGLEWPEEAEAQVMGSIRDRLAAARLDKGDRRYGWRVSMRQAGLALPLSRIVLAAEALLRSEDLARLRNCERCSWLFIDRGRGRARRWCSMAACGSRAKSARYYERTKAKTA